MVLPRSVPRLPSESESTPMWFKTGSEGGVGESGDSRLHET